MCLSTWGEMRFLSRPGCCSSGGRGMLLEQIGEAPSAQRLSPGVDEHLGCCDPPANGEPGAQCCGRGLPQGERPFPPSLAKNTNAHRRQVDVLELQSRQLGHAQPRTDRQMQHGPVADAIACGRIRSVEHGLQLLPQKIGHQAPIRLLERDRQDAADCSSAAGCRYSRKRKNDLMAASRTLRVTARFCACPRDAPGRR